MAATLWAVLPSLHQPFAPRGGVVAPPMRKEPHTMHDAAYYYMPLFSPGVSVMLGASRETVSHVVLRRFSLMVYLQGHEKPVYPESLQLEPTAFQLTRRPEPE